MQLRIQKFLSQCGYCSRRHAEALIQEGRISVNGLTATLGQCVDEDKDIIKVDQVRVQKRPQTRTVLLLNKPRGVECTQPWGNKKTVYDFIPKPFQNERFFYCGRLDKDSQGMLLLTNDGDFANQVTHPRSNIVKIYYVTLEHPLAPEFLGKMLTGIYDEGECLKAEKVFVLPNQGRYPALEIHLKQGRKREIRRMIQYGESFVHRLKRTQIGQLKLKNLAVGATKVLSPEEIALLFQ
ncbi:MAG: rRNA pseudouridine synthase [Verrucomicrobiota bacterium]|nr:MAG: rRNA pseudouridine synthase [Verrucomicrobiota bacterium]